MNAITLCREALLPHVDAMIAELGRKAADAEPVVRRAYFDKRLDLLQEWRANLHGIVPLPPRRVLHGG